LSAAGPARRRNAGGASGLRSDHGRPGRARLAGGEFGCHAGAGVLEDLTAAARPARLAAGAGTAPGPAAARPRATLLPARPAPRPARPGAARLVRRRGYWHRQAAPGEPAALSGDVPRRHLDGHWSGPRQAELDCLAPRRARLSVAVRLRRHRRL